MRLRNIILVLALLAALAVSSGGYLYYSSLKKAAFNQEDDHAETRVELLKRQLAMYLSEHIKPVKALAGIEELETALKKKDTVSIKEVNPVLDNFAEALDLNTCYLMDNKGVTIASSNRKAKDSFVGKNFSFRPYFKNALAGDTATYLALGTTSGKRGVYYSHPVYDAQTVGLLGVAVIKASVELVEALLFTDYQGILLVTDPNGLIFISNKNELRFKLMWELSPERIQKIQESRQFGRGPWPWAGFYITEDRHVENRYNSEEYIYSTRKMDNYPGWKIINLRARKEIGQKIADPFLKLIGPVILVVSILIGGCVFILYTKALQEIIRRRHAEKELRQSEKKYRHIYNKTPVMLHSIDTEGKIIRVSDYWLEKMEYRRNEVIGSYLTGFYTEKSKKYAEEIIFPEFFKTGFCRNVPYTYVKKSGGQIDILLSCYGVRNEQGAVERSLAVSVDVTEKNQVQKALEQAKEKLSRYSVDLEHQVAKRTSELQKAQESLRKLSKNIMDAQERERSALSRELHDHLGQVLTALRIDAVWIARYFSDRDANAALRANRICSLIDDTIADVRDMAFKLRPGVLDDLGLVEALESLTNDVEERSDISCVFIHSNVKNLPGMLATVLYRITQEAITNVLRHARASVIEVDLRKKDNMIELTIKDNGCGFSLASDNKGRGFGLTGMQERAILAGGELHITAENGKGTTICCSVPERSHF